MIKYLLDFEKSATLILCILVGATITSFLNTPMLLHIELDNIFNSFLINDMTNNVITTNLEATSTPPLFFWIKHIIISVLGFDLSLLKAIPAFTMCAVILISYTFLAKQTGLKGFAIIVSIILATSPFFVTASKLISFDLIYMLIYISTTFIFTSNVYSNNYSNLATFIAGILLASSFSLSGFAGAAPIIMNYLLINFVRGGFFINLKFNNPLALFTGFAIFIAIWVASLAKQLGLTEAMDLVFNYHFIADFATFEFDEGALMKYTILFIIGGFPWISLLPSALWNTIKTIPNRLHTSDLQTSLPLISLINSLMLTVYFSFIEQEFYILLVIFFNFALMIGDRLNNIEIKTASFLNIIFFLYSIGIMLLFLNEFLDIELTTYQLDITIKELLINEHTSAGDIPNQTLYIMAGGYIIGSLILFLYTITRSKLALTLTCMLATLNLLIFSFIIFPNLKNNELNNSRSMDAWLTNTVLPNTNNMVFYKTKDPIVASKANRSFYFDDLIKARDFMADDEITDVYIYFNKEDRRLVARLKPGTRSKCRNETCILRIK